MHSRASVHAYDADVRKRIIGKRDAVSLPLLFVPCRRDAVSMSESRTGETPSRPDADIGGYRLTVAL